MQALRVGLLFLGVSMSWVGCVVESSSDDDDGGEGWGGKGGSSNAGKGGSSAGSGTGGSVAAGYGGTGGKGGSGGKGGTGDTGGAGGTGGSTGGTWAGGEGGEPGATGGTGGGSAGSYPAKGGSDGVGGDPGEGGAPWSAGGAPAVGGEGGSAGGEVDPTAIECDPEEGELDNTPYPDCEPTNSEDECELCVEANCCEESQECWGFSPGNVCGWGGVDALGEITCYQQCMIEWVEENGACGLSAQNECANSCITEECNAVGNATWALAQCMHSNCPQECFGDGCE